MEKKLTSTAMLVAFHHVIEADMNAFHVRTMKDGVRDNRDTIDEDGMHVSKKSSNSTLEVYIWPPRVFARTGIYTTCTLN